MKLINSLLKNPTSCLIDINNFSQVVQDQAKTAKRFNVVGTNKLGDVLFDIRAAPIKGATEVVGISYKPEKNVRLKCTYLSDGKDIIATSPQDIYIGLGDTLDISWKLPLAVNYVEGTLASGTISMGGFSEVDLGLMGKGEKLVDWYWDTDSELGNEHGQYALIKGKTPIGAVRHEGAKGGSGKAYRAFPIDPIPFTLVGSTTHNTLREAKLMVEAYHGLEDVPCAHQMFLETGVI